MENTVAEEKYDWNDQAQSFREDTNLPNESKNQEAEALQAAIADLQAKMAQLGLPSTKMPTT